VAQYADSYFEYDGQQRVIKEIAAAGTQSYSYTYTTSEFGDDPNNWHLCTVETRPDGSTRTVYMNNAGQPMIDDLSDGTNHWITYQSFDDQYRVLQIASPSAIDLSGTPYDPAYANLNVQLLRLCLRTAIS
jgi:hypothetical protein